MKPTINSIYLWTTHFIYNQLHLCLDKNKKKRWLGFQSLWDSDEISLILATINLLISPYIYL